MGQLEIYELSREIARGGDVRHLFLNVVYYYLRRRDATRSSVTLRLDYRLHGRYWAVTEGWAIHPESQFQME